MLVSAANLPVVHHCFSCEKHLSDGEMLTHFQECMGAYPVDHVCHTLAEKILTIRVLTDDEFWLQAEVRGGLKLLNLYMFLRGHSYECCGYISPVRVNNVELLATDLQKPVHSVLQHGDTLSYASNSDIPRTVSALVIDVHYRALEEAASPERCDVCLAGMH